jgi:hypothetical protein
MIERSGRFYFLNRSMDNPFLNRVNSRQGLVKKEQEPIFEESIGSLCDLKISFKDAKSACACSFKRSLSRSNSIRFKKGSSIPLIKWLKIL